MNPPTRLDEGGRPRDKQPCPTCGREIPVVTFPPDLLNGHGWVPFQAWGVVEWCGHRVERLPADRGRGYRLIPILGEAS
jgi:hypothetical protein